MSLNIWELLFVLPNLSFEPQPAFETDELALVSYKDLRLERIRSTQKTENLLLAGFRSTLEPEVKIEPSALIARTDWPKDQRTLASLAAFRNCISTAVNVRAWTACRPGSFPTQPRWSDSFEFSPVIVGSDGNLQVFSPALDDWWPNHSKFHGSPSLYISRDDNQQLAFDQVLLERMLAAWHRHFVSHKKSKCSKALFRSLAVAYNANRVPVGNLNSIFDWGISIALWVNALEILARAASDQASDETVIDLLGQFRWQNEELDAQNCSVTLSSKKGRHPANLVQWLYKNLYMSRNDFIHGNDIREQYLRPCKSQPDRAITTIAPIIYRTALASYLGIRPSPLQDRQGEYGDFAATVGYRETLRPYREFLLQCVSK